MKRNLNLFSKLLASYIVLTFWSMLLTAITFPYQVFRVFVPKRKPGRPGGSLVSKFFKQAFENKKIRKFVGVGLTVIIVFFGLMGNILAANIEMTNEPTLISTPKTKISTKTVLQKPFEGVIGQGYHAFHRAIDVLSPIGTEIRPIAAGVVIEARFGKLGWGTTIVVKHDDRLVSRYAHLKDIRVIEGEMVGRGQVIGTVGMTGWTTGPHLHLEVYENGKAINPLKILPNFEAGRLALVK
ncbi:MAG: M23 family metallopeptidase [Patescibacteria group bacterium]|nr:M23 family metallopeptidase [Patescibacteria group bacterium]